MDQYIGTKIVRADPMKLVDAEEKLDRKIKPGNEDGYLVGYPDGYESWSPKEIFERAYRRTDGMTFGLALEAMRQGHKVARSGWNGRGMWIRIVNPQNPEMFRPFIEMKPVDGRFAPFTPAQCDVLAEDWTIVE